MSKTLNVERGTDSQQRVVSHQTLERSMMYLMSYKGNPYVAQGCLCLALGLPHIAGAGNQTELAMRLGVTKAAVNKCINQIQMMIPELTKLATQRDAESRSKMRKARISQLLANSD